jgi:hypothetical protein
MKYYLIGCIGVAICHAQATAQTMNAAASSTGSPSGVAATVSPVTVAQAIDRFSAPFRSISLSLGTSYASGDFGTDANAQIWNTSVGVRYATGPLRITASIPYMRIRSNGAVFTGIDSTPIVVASPRNGRIKSDGLGDLTLGASYTRPMDGAVELEFSGRIKFATASRASGLSSGKTDYAGAVQISKIVGRFAPFVSGGYRVLGDPSSFDLRNGVSASIGSSMSLNDKTVMLASYHFAQTASHLVQDSHELFAGASRRVGTGNVLLTGFATAGLSSGASAISAGLGLSFRL